MADGIDAPAAVKSGILRKKVAGVPVLYLLLAGVLVLAIVAYRMRGQNAEDDAAPTDGADVPAPESDASDLSQTDGGTVPTFVANPVPTYEDSTSGDGTVGNATIPDNDTWLRKAVEFLVTQGESGGNAQAVLQKYLRGDQLSVEEGKMRDRAVRQFGLPPDPFDTGGTAAAPKTGAAAVKKVQPGAVHTVQGNYDNSYHKLAGLYFNDTDFWFDTFQAANPKLGNSNGPWPVGTKVNVPVYRSGKYYTTTKSVNTSKEVAAKNGISVYALNTMNDGVSSPYKPGTRLRVA